MKRQQQGDVWIEKIDSLPTDLKVKETGQKVTLFDGEVTGHAHRLISENVEGSTTFIDKKGNLFLEVKEDSVLTHEEHGLQVIEKGIYQIGQIVEFDYETEENKPVID